MKLKNILLFTILTSSVFLHSCSCEDATELKRKYEKLKQINKKLKEENKKLRQKLEEYKKIPDKLKEE